MLFARTEGILPRRRRNTGDPRRDRRGATCTDEGQVRGILVNLCGHGHFDMQAYMDFADGKLKDPRLRRGRARQVARSAPHRGAGGHGASAAGRIAPEQFARKRHANDPERSMLLSGIFTRAGIAISPASFSIRRASPRSTVVGSSGSCLLGRCLSGKASSASRLTLPPLVGHRLPSVPVSCARPSR